jgi:hypothetical protein
MLVSIFTDFHTVSCNQSLPAVLKDIQDGRYRDQVEQLRQTLVSGKKDEYDKLKKTLPAFTPSGTFKTNRKLELLDEYSSFVHLDFDKLTPEQISNTLTKVSEIPHTYACFLSPSNNGLKVFVEVTTGPDQHELAYKQVRDYYETATGIPCDPKCKDITRLCFVSYDPRMYSNYFYKPFNVNIQKPVVEVKPSPPPAQPDHQKIFEDCIRFTQLEIPRKLGQ